MIRLFSLISLCCAGTLGCGTVAAQSTSSAEANIRGFDELGLATGPWTTDDVAGAVYGSIRAPVSAGEHTIMMVHVGIDGSTNSEFAEGVVEIYPFLKAQMQDWTVGATASGPTNEFLTTTDANQEVGIPPHRLRKYLNLVCKKANLPISGRGLPPHTASSSQTLEFKDSTGWHNAPPSSRAPDDERNAWLASSAWVPNGNQPSTRFHIASVARAAVIAAAHEAADSQYLNDQAIENLYEFLNQEIGFVVAIQPVHIRIPIAPELPVAKLPRPKFFRKRSLKELAGNGYWLAHGPLRYLPDVTSTDKFFYIGARSDELHVLFPSAQTGVRAWIATTTGLVPTDQLLDVTPWEVTPYHSAPGTQTVPNRHVARFPYPGNGLAGTIYFTKGNQVVVPEFPESGGALVWATGDLSLPQN